MSFSRNFIGFWQQITQAAIHKYKRVPKNINFNLKRVYTVPPSIGFSIFTWLGFDKKFTAEDDLINTIKHCVLFIQRTEFEKAEQLLHVALRQAQQLRHELGITYIYDVMANLALERDHLAKAKTLFVTVSQRLLADGAKDDDLRIIHISAKLARISHLNKDYQVAQTGYEWCLSKINNALQLEPKEETKKLLAMTEDWYGRLFVDCNNIKNGLSLMISALNHMKEVTDIELEHIVLQINDIGTVYDKIGNLDESLKYFKEAVELGRRLENYEDLGTMYVNLGRAYIKKNLLDNARKSCGYAWKLGKDSNSKEITSEAELCLQEIKNANM